MPDEERERLVQELWAQSPAKDVQIAWLTLVTPADAEVLLLTRPEASNAGIGSWIEFAQASLNDKQEQGVPVENRDAAHTRTVVFYSYKGGVGRTTAMLHVAYLLAQEGKRIALVDMDLEAPGLRHAVEALEPDPSAGLVDYLYERQILPSGLEPNVGIQDIVGRVKLRERIKGELYIIPAGKVDLRYMSMVDDLDAKLGNAGPQAWRGLMDVLSAHLKPDLIFVDSRTGFNRWGAVSLLLLADEAFVFAHPNRQNLEGLMPLLQAIKQLGRPPLTVVFSMVVGNNEGKSQAERAWEEIAPLLNLPADTQVLDRPASRGRPVFVYYDARVATAPYLPVADAQAYSPLLASLRDVAEEASHIEALASASRLELDPAGRVRLLETLRIPRPYANEDFSPEQFQPIRVLAEVLKPEVCLIRGRKGTGKSYLFRMFQTKYIQEISSLVSMSSGPETLSATSMIPAHGEGVPSLSADQFLYLAQQMARTSTWEVFWSSYALLRLWLNDRSQSGPRLPMSDPAFEPYKQVLARISPGRNSQEAWGQRHIEVILELTRLPEMRYYTELFMIIETGPTRGRGADV